MHYWGIEDEIGLLGDISFSLKNISRIDNGMLCVLIRIASLGILMRTQHTFMLKK